MKVVTSKVFDNEYYSVIDMEEADAWQVYKLFSDIDAGKIKISDYCTFKWFGWDMRLTARNLHGVRNMVKLFENAHKINKVNKEKKD